MRPISTNTGPMEADDYGLTPGTFFITCRLEVVAVAVLLWLSWCIFGGAGFFLVFAVITFFFNFRARVHDRWPRDPDSSQRRLGEGAPTVSQSVHRELAPTYLHQVYCLWCSHLRNMACHQLVDQQSSSHQPKPTSLILELSNFK